MTMRINKRLAREFTRRGEEFLKARVRWNPEEKSLEIQEFEDEVDQELVALDASVRSILSTIPNMRETRRTGTIEKTTLNGAHRSENPIRMDELLQIWQKASKEWFTTIAETQALKVLDSFAAERCPIEVSVEVYTGSYGKWFGKDRRCKWTLDSNSSLATLKPLSGGNAWTAPQIFKLWGVEVMWTVLDQPGSDDLPPPLYERMLVLAFASDSHRRYILQGKSTLQMEAARKVARLFPAGLHPTDALPGFAAETVGWFAIKRTRETTRRE